MSETTANYVGDKMFQYEKDSANVPYRYKNGKRRTIHSERTIEIPLVLLWLDRLENTSGEPHSKKDVLEIGAVTPYYESEPHPKLEHEVIDPTDPKGTIAKSMFAIDFLGKDVFSISTIEHIDSGEYNVPKEGKTPIDALYKLYRECTNFLVTFPFGWEQGGTVTRSPLTDEAFRLAHLHSNVTVRMISRTAPHSDIWAPSDARIPWGEPWGRSGNTCVIVEKGHIL